MRCDCVITIPLCSSLAPLFYLPNAAKALIEINTDASLFLFAFHFLHELKINMPNIGIIVP